MAFKPKMEQPGGKSEKPPEEISRRSLLKGAAAFGAAKALLGPVENAEAAHGQVRQEVVQRRIDQVVETARALIADGEPRRFFGSPYLLYALYYSANFGRELSQKADRDVSEEVVFRITRMLTQELRHKYMQLLDDMGKRARSNNKISAPLESLTYSRGKNHPDAIDLFIKEGAPVKSMTNGVVILAEANWKRDDPFSVSSLKGGNAVLVYDAGEKEFYRYCHLQNVSVKSGEMIAGGMTIGTVGHTGTNASKPGHGNHLHLEINRYDSVRNANSVVLEQGLKERVETATRQV